MYIEDVDEISMISQASAHTLSSEHVVEAPTEQVGETTSDEEECCICYENIGAKNNCVTECGHKFCFKCLAMAMTKSNACPCCRQPLTDEPEVDEDEDESEYDDEEEDDASDMSEEEDDVVSIEIVAERLEKNGFTMLDMVAMFMGANVGNLSEKYSPLNMDELYAKCDNIINEARKEAEELAMFAAEDTRV